MTALRPIESSEGCRPNFGTQNDQSRRPWGLHPPHHCQIGPITDQNRHPHRSFSGNRKTCKTKLVMKTSYTSKPPNHRPPPSHPPSRSTPPPTTFAQDRPPNTARHPEETRDTSGRRQQQPPHPPMQRRAVTQKAEDKRMGKGKRN